MRTEIYACDRCKAVVKVDDLRRVELRSSASEPQRWGKPPRKDRDLWYSREWCETCLLSFGMFAAAETPNQSEPVAEYKASLEDVIREIVRSEINQTKEQS